MENTYGNTQIKYAFVIHNIIYYVIYKTNTAMSLPMKIKD